jgi:hypothetical protein
MKLLFCKKCQDVFKISQRLKTCDCGMTKGMYNGDDIHAQYAGPYAVPLGFRNSTFAEAIKNQPDKDTEDRQGGVNFDAFVIPKACATLERIN